MSRQPIPPPPGDRPVPTAPPPPPRWRFSLWPIALLAVVLLYIFLPGIKVSTPVSLSYSQFIADAGAHKIKTWTSGTARAARTPAACRSPAGAGDGGRVGGVPDSRQADARAPAQRAGDRPT
jgi:hypothetical protein